MLTQHLLALWGNPNNGKGKKKLSVWSSLQTLAPSFSGAQDLTNRDRNYNQLTRGRTRPRHAFYKQQYSSNAGTPYLKQGTAKLRNNSNVLIPISTKAKDK